MNVQSIFLYNSLKVKCLLIIHILIFVTLKQQIFQFYKKNLYFVKTIDSNFFK